jgi:hydrogenase maturation protease
MVTLMGITTKMDIKKRQPRILIAGLGNYLLQDDGVGVHTVRALQQAPLPGVLVAEVGTAVLSALHLFEWAERILAIDAMQAGGRPGTIYAFEVEDAAGPGMQTSLHELNLLAGLRFLRRQANPEILIVGIEPETIDYGLDLSPAVAAALPELTQEILMIMSGWTEEAQTDTRLWQRKVCRVRHRPTVEPK